MKQRFGFVSNSSSSSFVVAFPKILQNAAEMQELIFGKESFWTPSDSYYGKYPASRVAETLFEDFMKQIPLTKNKLIKELTYGWITGQPDWDYSDDKKQREKIDKAITKFKTALAKKFMKANKGKFFYLFSYADENGSYYSALEHGGIFDSLPHIVISHH